MIGRLIIVLTIWMMMANVVADNRNNINNTKDKMEQVPDFRYPQTVSQNALTAYDAAIKKNDYSKALEALIQYALAETSRSDSAMTDVMSKCEALYNACDKAEYRVMVDHLRSRMWMAYANHNWTHSAEYMQKAREYHKSAKLMAEGLDVKTQQMGENLLRADAWGWRIIPSLSDYLRQYEYENWGLREERIDQDGYLKQWRSLQNDLATEMYLEYKLVEMQERDQQHAALKRYVETYPESPYLASCKNSIAQMERETVNVDYKELLSSHAEIEVNVTVDNLYDCTLTLYRVPDGLDCDKDERYSVSDLVKVAETKVHIDDGEIPFYGNETTATFPPQVYGKYVILPSFTDKNGNRCEQEKVSASRWYNQLLTVTDLAAYTVQEGKNRTLVVVDRTTGEPQKDVKIERKENQYKLTRGADRYSDWVNVYTSDYSLPKARNEVNIYTDLKIYRPGETLRGTVVVSHCSATERKPLSGSQCTITLSDGRNNEVCTKKDSLDSMGQVVFEMQIPEDRMNGNWTIECQIGKDHKKEGWGYTSVEVSEYKLPTFSVDMSETPSVQPKGANGVVKGQAMTFTGMPVADAEVELTLDRHSWWRWSMDYQPFDEKRLTVRTDAQGRFSFDCPAEWLQVGDNGCYVYLAQVSCTNTAGERHDASCSFTVGKAERISLSGGDMLLPSDGKIKLPAEYHSSENEQITVMCHYRLEHLQDTMQVVKEGDVMSNDLHVDWNDVPSGQYRLVVNVVGKDIKEHATLTLYREIDKQSASDKVLWIPNPTRRLSKDGKTTDILIGVQRECYIYYIVESRTGVVNVKSHWWQSSKRWLHYKPGMHHLCLPMPEGPDDYLTIKMVTMLDGKTYSETVRVDCQRKERLQLAATSFRDKTKPGQSETWSFRLTDQDGNPVKSARMVLEAYNKALKQLASNEWNIRADYLSSSLCGIRTLRVGNNNVSVEAVLKPLDECRPQLPQLWLYGQDFFSSGRVGINAVYCAEASPAMASRAMSKGMMVANEEVEAESALVSDNADISYDNSESVATDSATEMRTGDLHVALWEPRLTSDEDGNVEVTFDVPQQNATWVVQALAYSKSMTTSKWDGEVLVQRELMVQPVLPRFVRQGDHVVLKAQVMNATDSVQQAHVVLELFDPRTDVVVKSEVTDIDIAAKGTQVVQIACDVPNDQPYIGVRIKASSDNGSGDGEQQLLPVASNAQPVVETYPFYMQPEVTILDHTLEAPNGNKPDLLTLEFCANPTWYCVKALPSMIDEDARTSISMAHSLFAIVLADKLRADSVVDIAAYDKLIGKLQSLQKKDGGFAWIDYKGCVSSEWATGTVVELIGELYHLGCLADDHKLMQMARKGILYMERKAKERAEWIVKAKNDDFSSLMPFAYQRLLFKDVCPVSDADVQGLLDKIVESLCKTWGRFSLSDKAFIALTLNRTGHQDVARNVVESLRQFAIYKPAKGMYWERLRDGFWFHPVAATSVILQAMAEVDPRTEELNRIRQWLLLEKQTSDWGSSSLASDAVYALLSTGDDWLRDMSDSQFTVSVDGNRVEAQVTDQKMGYLKMDLPKDSKNVHIERSEGTPAWGAIFWQYVAPVTEIREAQLPEVSIRKTFMVQDADGKWVPVADTLRVGQRVQVRLDVHADKALEYVTLTDERPAMLEPVDQTSHYEWGMGEGYFHETKDRQTILYIHRLRAGDHTYTYECDVTHEGTFASGIATVVSNYAPQFTAHTSGAQFAVGKR